MDGVKGMRTSFLATIFAGLVVLTYADPASACRTPLNQPPVSEAELKRQADEGLVRLADAIVMAEISQVQAVSPEWTDVSFSILSPVRGAWPVEINPDEFIVTCDVAGNHGVYEDARVGDRVLLFLTDKTVFHAEPVGTPRAADLMSIVSRGAQ